MTTSPDPRTQAAMDTPAGQLGRQLYGLAAVRRELSKVANRELPGHGFGVLVSIRKREGARVSDVASDLQVDLSVASRQIASLVSAGLVERRPDPADRRAHVLGLTDEGIAALRGAYLDMVGLIDDALADWTHDEVIDLASKLDRLVASFTTFTGAAAVAATGSTTPDSSRKETVA